MGWQGNFKEKEKFPMIKMKVACDNNLRIWHIMFGVPGTKNY